MKRLTWFVTAFISVFGLNACYEEPFDWTLGEDIVVATDFAYETVTPGTATFTFEIRKAAHLNVKELQVEYSSTTGMYTTELGAHGDGMYRVELSGLVADCSYDVTVKGLIDGWKGEENHSSMIELGTSGFRTAVLGDGYPALWENNVTVEGNILHISGIIRQGGIPVTGVVVKYRENGKTYAFSEAAGTVNGDNFTADITGLKWDTGYEYYIELLTADTRIASGQLYCTTGIPFKILSVTQESVSPSSASFSFVMECYSTVVVKNLQLNTFAMRPADMSNTKYWANTSINSDYKGGTFVFSGLSPKTRYVMYWGGTAQWQDNRGVSHSCNMKEILDKSIENVPFDTTSY